MGKRAAYEPGVFCWADLATTDPEGAKAFYGGLFGWQAEDISIGDARSYTMLHLDGDYVGALYEMGAGRRERGVSPHWFSYVKADDVGRVAERARELGGSEIRAPFDIGNSGRAAVLQDPTGALFGAWEPLEHAGAVRVNDAGCLAWNELQTREPERASGFYSELFGWDLEPMEEEGKLVYALIKKDGWSNGGIMPMTEQHGNAPPYWLPYFTVASCDGAVSKVRELGGKVLAEPFEPGAGRISILSDPQGAVFAIFEGETDD